MATWTGTDEPTSITMIEGRQYHVYKVFGTDVDTGDTFELDPVAHGMTQVCTLSFFGVTADGVAELLPVIANASADGGDLETEVTTPAATLIRNQSPACLLLDSGPIEVDIGANVSNLAVRVTLIFATGQDVRGA